MSWRTSWRTAGSRMLSQKPPSQWLEEAMVEAFSLRGLGRLAERWKEAPPFPGDNAYGDAIAGYCRDIIQRYTKLATEQGLLNDPAAWVCKPHRRDRFARAELICAGGVTTILAEYERA